MLINLIKLLYIKSRLGLTQLLFSGYEFSRKKLEFIEACDDVIVHVAEAVQERQCRKDDFFDHFGLSGFVLPLFESQREVWDCDSSNYICFLIETNVVQQMGDSFLLS